MDRHQASEIGRVEAARARTPGIQVKNALAPLDERPVGVPADDRRESCGGGIEIECMAVMQHIKDLCRGG